MTKSEQPSHRTPLNRIDNSSTHAARTITVHTETRGLHQAKLTPLAITQSLSKDAARKTLQNTRAWTTRRAALGYFAAAVAATRLRSRQAIMAAF